MSDDTSDIVLAFGFRQNQWRGFTAPKRRITSLFLFNANGLHNSLLLQLTVALSRHVSLPLLPGLAIAHDLGRISSLDNLCSARWGGWLSGAMSQ